MGFTCGNVVLEAGKGKNVKRQAGRRGRKIGKSTKDDGEENQDCKQKQQTNKSPERIEENKGKPDTRQVDNRSGCIFLYQKR